MELHSRPDLAVATSAVFSGFDDPLVPTIFHEEWWLDAATRGRVNYVEVVDGGRTVGRMPYLVAQRYGITNSNMPTLTHFLGPGIDDGTGKATNRLVRRQSITQELIRKLPPLSSFRQKLHKGVRDALPFQAEGYDVFVQFTFEVAAAPACTIWESMRDKTRNVIRRAEESLRVRMNMGADEFIHFSRCNLAARGICANIDFAICSDIMTKALARGRGCIWAAEDQQGATKAAILCVWDRRACYYLMSTRSIDSGNGAIPLLIWNAIQMASSMGLVFDFDGVSSKGAILFFSGFGGETTPRYIVSRSSRYYQVLRQIRRLDPLVVNYFT